ncbi:protein STRICTOSIDINE SYNTHASE-LIKE 10-like [Malania oleifera]|uniref:protein STRICTOSIDINE SYNTHASE-LIKE 10-like n=1 Tax=Malania oleifera TaxID=397392 RepID=UPI0025AEC492|nr:protein STRICTOSIDINE SYNTHASE-LIKE 10-like [Malania oleifera]
MAAFLPDSAVRAYKQQERVRHYTQIDLISSSGGAVGPESVAFDCAGEGPYTGVSDGRILKWEPSRAAWADFAFTSPNRKIKECDPAMEQTCGRPLGLKFDSATCDLYIADAYWGLMVVGRGGGVARRLSGEAEGVPFRFTNALDVDEKTGEVYFTDTSTRFQRWEFQQAMISGDKTGRLMKYDRRTNKVTVLLRGLSFANGVALSKDSAFVLVAETSAMRVVRYWLRGPMSQTSELFLQLEGHPDNVKRNAEGEFWVAQNVPYFVGQTAVGVPLRVSHEGQVLEVLSENIDSRLEAVSEVEERWDSLWVGSVVLPYVGVLA